MAQETIKRRKRKRGSEMSMKELQQLEFLNAYRLRDTVEYRPEHSTTTSSKSTYRSTPAQPCQTGRKYSTVEMSWMKNCDPNL